VVITGGSSGIGLATARRFAAEGDDVLIVGRSADRLAEASKGWPNIRTLAVDITDIDAPSAIIDHAMTHFNRVDILVNNAGTTNPAKLWEIDRRQAQIQIETNLLAPLMLAQQAVQHMRPGAVIVNVSSNSPMRGWPNNSIYGSTKISLDFLTRTWALELAPRGIRVVSIAPGITETPILDLADKRLTPEEREAKKANRAVRIPIGRVAQPDEIAWWIVTVTRPEAGYMTGSVVRVDGGVNIM
jgi:NAD(P)-dependent dehydrogenase (short-subunit alcohol dehydrogenase family)